MLKDKEWKKYPVGSIGYYKSMQAYITPEHLRERYKSYQYAGNLKLKKAVRAKIVRLKHS